MTNNQLTDERLVKILSETQATIMEHNSRCVRGSVEVDARLFESMIMELQERRKAAMDGEPNRNPVLAYADSYRDMAKQGVESVQIWSVITDLERNIAPLYRHAQPAPGVPEKCPAEIRDLIASHSDALFNDDDAKEIWNGCRAAMLQAGNSPVIPEGYVMVPAKANITMIRAGGKAAREYMESYGGNSPQVIYQAMLAAAPQEVK
ncbi:hypothetical protein [Klebsiella michiganensis]|uniref:hypothetical protein n=1 Tax=Klebsiella michiganensis TaxID=1134687 RepID=UPI0027BB239F|nr:hypothetical protein [Klebsiella michiganensis]MDQ2144752.1 hypothetical protein [Klebsiella michiganensis]MDV6972732.1 hypothetical protein [Klebsiella michiganensis]MDW5481911.1 hypothetical protein [Klebsiella michiganensis]MDW5496262.1 hypothetical protein [Klebsiella michiganensis]MDZ5710019.1 hypothetical protein [Klebsiella michiganensis]